MMYMQGITHFSVGTVESVPAWLSRFDTETETDRLHAHEQIITYKFKHKQIKQCKRN